MTTTESRNRIIRQMFAAINHPISKLQRLSYATVNLGRLESKQYRPLTGAELERLRALASGKEISSLSLSKQSLKPGGDGWDYYYDLFLIANDTTVGGQEAVVDLGSGASGQLGKFGRVDAEFGRVLGDERGVEHEGSHEIGDRTGRK